VVAYLGRATLFVPMYIKIKKLEMVPDKFGKHIKITMIGLYEDDDKFIKWIGLQEVSDLLLNAKIKYGS
jgi:hypothetical protein